MRIVIIVAVVVEILAIVGALLAKPGTLDWFGCVFVMAVCAITSVRANHALLLMDGLRAD